MERHGTGREEAGIISLVQTCCTTTQPWPAELQARPPACIAKFAEPSSHQNWCRVITSEETEPLRVFDWRFLQSL
jgi:hypothetical protein